MCAGLLSLQGEEEEEGWQCTTAIISAEGGRKGDRKAQAPREEAAAAPWDFICRQQWGEVGRGLWTPHYRGTWVPVRDPLSTAPHTRSQVPASKGLGALAFCGQSPGTGSVPGHTWVSIQPDPRAP